MAYYDIDTENFARDNTPQFKRERFPALLGFIAGLLKPFTRLIAIFKAYKEGVTNNWVAGTYYKGDIVAYNGQVFEAITTTTTATPDNTGDWRLIFTNWQGAYKVQTFSTSTMMLEYALNNYWGLTFSPTPGASDIYITTNTQQDAVFAVGEDSLPSSKVGIPTSEGVVPVTYTLSSVSPSFTIHVPFVWYFNLSFNADEKIRAFADNYVAMGLTYNITTY